jgi:Flp pilus assembly protein TadD
VVARRQQPLSRSWRQRVLFGAMLIVAAAVIGLGFRPIAARIAGEFPSPRELEPSTRASLADFVGADRCANCHVGQFSAWRQSTHGRAGGAPSATAIPAFAGAAIRFANAQVTPRVRAGVYEFVVRQPEEPEKIFRVDGVVGGGHMVAGGTQAYVTHRADGTWRILPFEWSRQEGSWFCNTNSRTGKGWTPITPSLRLEECGDWPPIRVLGDHPRYANCQSCHASQAVVELDTAASRYNTSFTSLAINCESCHGPGKRHVELAEGNRLGASEDVGLAALETFDKNASLQVCYQCHAVKDRLRPGYVSGDSLASYYSTKLPLLGERPLHPDGRVRTFAYQEGHQFSDCYLNGGMTCVSCHDPHSQGYRSVTGAPLSNRFDDRQCTSCHVSKADRVREHTGHPPAVTCVSCHMPARQEPETRAQASSSASTRIVPYARSDHTISIPRPRVDSVLGMASACAACHASMPVVAQEQRIAEWWETVKPIAPAIASQLAVTPGTSLADAARSLLGTPADSAESTFARFAGISRFLESYTAPDMELSSATEARLRELATSKDVDIRAAALATLHFARGDDRHARRTMAAALRFAGARDAGLRSRWSIILGYLGDRYSATGDYGHASLVYARALEVQPASAQLWLSLGNAQRNAGDYVAAEASYRKSIALDARAALPWVNLGIALLERRDMQGAAAALSRASAMDPNEPLVWFNLGNVALLRGDVSRADELYRRTLALDPSIALANFQLARVRMLVGDSAAALFHVRRGLSFDTTDAEARAFAAALERRFAPPARRTP